MGLFSRPKCPIHKIQYAIGKGFMSQLYYYCEICSYEKEEKEKLKNRVDKLEKELKELKSK